LEDELAQLPFAPPAGATSDVLLELLAKQTRRAFGENELVEVGIGCEACHGGAREHSQNPSKTPSFALQSPGVDSGFGESWTTTPAQQVTRVCSRCHTVLFSRYPHTWEGGQRRQAAGGSHINSGEAR